LTGVGRSTQFYAVVSIVAAVVTIGLKFGAYLLTGSVGLFSDAAESVVNLVAAVTALWALTLAARPPDEEHAFGHNKAEYFSSGLESALILIAAGWIAATAVPRLFEPEPLQNVGIGLAVTLVAFTLFAWLWPRTRPAELVPFSLTRDAGMAQARAFLERQGGPRYQKEYLALRHDDWALQSLRWALGPEGATRWLAAHGGYRAWTLRWVRPPSREEWSAEVGEGGRLAAFTQVLADSARPPEVAEPEARAAAEAFLAASGYPVAGLAPFESGVERDRGRTSRKFAWAEPGTVVPAPRSAGANADSGFVRLDVTVQGDRVTRFRRAVSVPETFRATIRSRMQTRSLPGMVIAVAGLVAGFGGLVLAARRTRLTALPWRAATGAGVVLGLLFAAGQGLNTTPVWAMRREPDSNWTAGFVQDRLLGQTLMLGLLLGAVLVPTIATVVPLLRATRAEAAAGVEPVLHGRPRRGALLDACLLGYPMAGLLLLATLPTPPWRPPSGDRYPELFNVWLPVTPLTEGLYVTVLTAVLVVLGVVVVSSWVRRPAVAVAALVAAAAAAGAVLGGWRGAVSLGGTAAVFAAGGWWVGLLPVVVAGYVSAAAQAATSLLDQGALIRKARFARETIPASVVAVQLITFVVVMGLLAVVCVAVRGTLEPALLLLPVVLACLAGFALGLALTVAILHAFYRDVAPILGAALLPWFFLSPIFFNVESLTERSGAVFALEWLNPVAPYIVAVRDVLYEGEVPSAAVLAYVLVAAVVALALGRFVFRRMERELAVVV